MHLTVYLSGEIHTDWRDRITEGIKKLGLPVTTLAPVTDHEASDNVGVNILGDEEKAAWKDRKGAGVNAVRTRTAIHKSDIVVVKFGEQYRQWNAAFEAGYAVALGKSLIVLHSSDLTHALKEIDAVAMAVAESPEQVLEILRYVSPAA